MSCPHCRAIEARWGREVADGDVKRYHRRGPDRTTRLILEMLDPHVVDGATLLDIGGGIGVICHELLARGVVSATLVDAASVNLQGARAEAEGRGRADRLRLVHGDFVELAKEVMPAELVTLDRVVCCYPDYAGLLAESAGKCRRAYAISYPRERWYVRLGFLVENLIRRLQRDPFRAFVHPEAEIRRVVRAAGLAPATRRSTLVWHVELYTRRPSEPQ
jgi:Methyltransferase small domain